MKPILFVHDHIFKHQGDNYYSRGGLPASVWARYLSVFPSLTVVGRDGGELTENEHGYTLSSTHNVAFRLQPSISNLKSMLLGNATVERACKTLVAESDGVIARLPSRLGDLFVKEAIKQGKPYAVEVVGCSWDALWNYGSWKGKLFAPYEMLSTRNTVRNAPFALYVTQHFLQGRYPCKRGITTSCSNVEIQPVADDVLHRRLQKIQQQGGTVKIGLIGNYSSRYKGIDVAIRALAVLNQTHADWELQILGSGDKSYYAELARELGVGDKVKFIGSKSSGQAVYDWLDEMDLYLQPSFQEGLPRALVEAMSRGCPALATSIAGIPELLSPSEMVEPGAHAALSVKIAAVINDKVHMEHLARENFETSKAYYKTILDLRRSAFWSLFRERVESSN